MPLGHRKKKRKVTLHRATDDLTDDPIMDVDGMLNEHAIVGTAVDTLHRLGLRIPKRPKNSDGTSVEIDYPSDLTKATLDQLGQLHGQLAAMVDYAGAQLAMMDSRHSIAKDNERAMRVVQELRGDATSIKQREKDATVNTVSRERSLVYHTCVAEYKLLQAVHEGFVNKQKSVSREFARRGLLVPGLGRNP